MSQNTTAKDIKVHEGDPGQEQMQADFEAMLLGQTANQSMNVANTRANLVQTDVGVKDGKEFVKEIDAGGRVLGTFGNTTYEDKGGKRFITFKGKEPTKPAAVDTVKDTTINLNAAASEMSTGVPTFNIEQEFKKVKAIADPALREDAAQQLYVNLAQQATTIGMSITEQARQRAGVNDAKSALDSYVAIENQMKANGQIPQYASSMQVRQARETYAKTLQMANVEEADMIKNNPQLNMFKRYDQLLAREFTQIDRTQAKQDSVQAQLPPMSDKAFSNVKFALELTTDSVNELSRAALNGLKTNKQFERVIQADKQTLPGLLVDADPKIRQYAYRILVGNEKVLNNGEVPDYVKLLEPLVADRTALIARDSNKDAAKGLQREISKGIGEKGKAENSTNYLLNHLQTQIQKTTERRYLNMDNWTFLNAEMKAIVEGVRTNSKDKAVLMSDGIDAVMKAKLKNPDGTEMRPEEKIKQLIASLDVSMKGDKKSVLLPSAEYYIGPMTAQLRNMAMRSYIQSQARLNQGLDPATIRFLREE